jgi:3-oxoacyl-[acyl-carrier protein] reductase
VSEEVRRVARGQERRDRWRRWVDRWRVFLAGRTQATRDAVANEIRSAGGEAETATVDALDEESVDRHADTVAAEGGIDISFNLIAHPYTHGVPFH